MVLIWVQWVYENSYRTSEAFGIQESYGVLACVLMSLMGTWN